MVVPTLVFGLSPSILFFRILYLVAYALLMALFLTAGVSHYILVYLLIPYWMLRRIPRQRGTGSCRRCTKAVFLSMGRQLCVYTFPDLFKMHKTHSVDGSKMREFMVFLDRKVERSLPLIAAFCCIIYGILYSSVTVFLQYFLWEQNSGKCIEKDNHDRPVFCYNKSYHLQDCSVYNETELRELHFDCYTIALVGGISIAFAAALAVVKVATLGITICVKVTEGYFKLTKNPPWKWPWMCSLGCSRKCADRVYLITSFILLFFVVPPVLSCLISIALMQPSYPKIFSTIGTPILNDYILLAIPALICHPLGLVIFIYLHAHCDKGEYVSIAADQRPLDPRDWDVESESSVAERQHDEASRQRECGDIIGEASGGPERAPLIDDNSDVTPTYGSTVRSDLSSRA